MPNYRNKNKNRKSKNRNKHNNQNQNQNKNQQQQEQQQQQQQQQSEDENQQQNQKQLDGLNVHGELHENLQISGNISKPAADECISVGYNTDASTSTAATHNESKTSNDAIRHSPIVEQNNHTATNKHPNTGTTATRTSHATIVSNNDTIPQEEPFTQHSDLLSSEDLITKINSATTEGTTKNMGVNNTKMLHTNETDSTTTNNSSGTNNEASKTTTTKVQQAKVIIHRIVQEPNLDVNVAEKVQQTQPNISSSQQKAKVIIHRIKLEEDVDGTYKQEVQQYKVESPKTIENVGNEKFSTEINKDLQILELSDTGSISDTNDSQLLSPLISEVESETEASTSVNESNTQILTIQTLPLSSVISVEEIGIDKSVSSSPTQDDAKQRRAQKRAALDNHFLPQLLSPRYLDSILEENSDMSDARSDCSDKPMSMHASLTDEQAHDVIKTKKANAVFPKSNLDFSRKHKHGTLPKIQLSPGAIREEPIAIVVETKLIDQTPTAEECCARLSSTLAPASEAAEVVYINSASSSMSDLMDLDVEDGTLQPSLSNIDLDTDAKEIISKPIELTNETAEAVGAVEVVEEDETTGTSDSRESTPVNQSTEISNELATSENSSKSNSNNLSITNQTIISKTLNYDNEEEQYKLIDELVRSANAVLSSGSIETMHTISDSERSEDVQSFDTNINSSDTESLPSSTNSDSFRLRADRTSSSAFVAIPSPLSSSSLSPSSSSLYSLPSHDLHLKNSEMNNVRDIINNQMQNEEELKYFPNKHETINNFGLSGSKVSTDASSNDNDIPYRSQVSHVFLENQKSEKISRDDSPPPIPPPPSGLHNYENATTMHGSLTNTTTIQHHITTPTQTPHELPHTPANTKLSLTSLSRQASADSHYSDSTNNSQCTAINVGLTTPQSDIDLPSSPFSDIASESTICGDFKSDSNEKPVKKLRFLCAETLASMPYGEEVLEELASVAQNIGEVSVANKTNKMPYPLPDLPHINDLQLSINKNVNPTTRIVTIKQLSTQQNDGASIPTPPSVSTGAPNTKNAWLGLPTDKNPNLLVCLSPSQRSYISEQQTKTIETQKADDLLDAHQKFIDRRGYHEYSAEQVKTMNNEKFNEQQILETAAVMKKLRKSLTPTPPPVPPPPVPTKSSDTAAKAQSQKKIANEYAFGQGHDASLLSSHRDVNKHTTKTITTTETETKTKTASVLANPPFTSSNENKNMNDDEEENKHRLLAIIHDSNDLKQSATKPKTSSFENNSRQPAKSAENKQGEPLQQTKQAHTERQSHTQTYNTSTGAVTEQKEHIVKSTATTTADMFPATKISATPFPTSNNNISTGMDSDFKSMFPSMGESSFYDANRKRFSNIETSNRSPFCSQLLSTQPKRFSNIETSSYESKKCIENGKVVYDYTNSNRESHTDGEPNANLHDIIQDAPPRSAASEDIKNVSVRETRNDEHKNKTAETHNIEIMSELNLNTKNTVDTTTTAKPAHTLNSSATQSTRGEQERREILKNRQQNENNYNNSDNNNISGGTYDVFRQHAKAAADTTTHPIAPFTAPATSNGGHEKLFDHEKLFKDFDDLSKQLHMELETGKSQKVQREKSTSLYDLNRMQMHAPYGRELENWKKQRHEHMKELEREIEKSMKSRQFRSFVQAPRTEQQLPTRTYDIPIHLEHGSNHNNAFTNNHMYEVSTPAETPSTISTPRTPYSGEQQRIYDIPIQLEPAITPEQHSYDYVDNSRFRRAESMFNLTDNMQPAYRQRADSMSYNNDDWSRYASDLGSSENIARPFAREVEICYQRSKPRTIRAPRLSVSTNDLSSNTQSYDSYNAYNVRRTHAPMLNQVPQKSRPQYLSCHSMIERNPNPTYISTTSRRGVSPAPPITPPTHVEQHYHVPEAEMRQRRASLPREIQEQQLKYIQSKEDELKTEFDRLQSERRRLMDEMNRVPQVPQRQQRDYYRPVPKLPTLSEDEVFRQQMAEEWLNKVAEREERRLQKIIKISKLNEETSGQQIPIQLNSTKPDISQEFLSRVKERRSKLAMPADSDWESGAESQPVGVGNVSETEELPTVKVLDGKIEADLNHLPRHLREFAKFSNHQKEQIDGGEREIHQEEEHRKEANNNAMSSATKKSSIVKTIKISRQPGTTGVIGGSRGSGAAVRNIPIAQGPLAYSTARAPHKSNGYLSEPEPNYDSDYSTIKYRTLDRRRLQSVSSAANVRSNANYLYDDKSYGTMPNPVKSGQNSYKNQPGRIEDYVTGNSSVSEKEHKEWWDEVMDIFNGHLDQTKLSPHYTEGNLSRALAKETGYTSDSNLVFRKKEVIQGSPLSPVEQKQAYKSLQAGGEPPLFGFRKPAPEKPKESPNRYYESDVNIHFKTPVRHEFKQSVSEDELAIRQAEHMQKLYQEERRRKYLQELQDMNSRRHTDNFTPTQKSPISLNRYDDFQSDLAPKSPSTAVYMKAVAKALYNFQGQSARELTFRKGDIIYIRRKIDANWYEGEHNAMIGLLPANYVEIINKEDTRRPQRKPSEGQARAKFNFQAQSSVELSLNKGELVTLTRRVDDNWFEGKIANRKGIFPVSYVEVLTDIGAEDIAAKTVITEQSVTNLRPSLDTLRTNINHEFNVLTQNGNQPPNGILKETKNLHKTDLLHVDTVTEQLKYRALYKYRPQNSDELELLEGDIVHVLEKCDDGWFVGTSQRTGCFGTFPGNYVERL